MKNRITIRNYLILILPLLFFPFAIQSQKITQEILGSAGPLEPSNRLVWTMGEIAVSNLSQEEISLQEGFHQGTLLLMTSIQNLQLPELKIYPNPTMDWIYIRHNQNFNVEAKIIDLSGKLVLTSIPFGQTGSIDVSNLRPGLYLLQLSQSGQILNTTKFSKL